MFSFIQATVVLGQTEQKSTGHGNRSVSSLLHHFLSVGLDWTGVTGCWGTLVLQLCGGVCSSENSDCSHIGPSAGGRCTHTHTHSLAPLRTPFQGGKADGPRRSSGGPLYNSGTLSLSAEEPWTPPITHFQCSRNVTAVTVVRAERSSTCEHLHRAEGLGFSSS